MKTYLQLENKHKFELPPKFQNDDVRYTESLVEYFLERFTQDNDLVFDPFAGFGTTLLAAESMNRIPLGIEFDEERFRYIRSKLKAPNRIIHGDSRRLGTYSLPEINFSMTSPPYMTKNDDSNPFTAYTTVGSGYAGYLADIGSIYEQIRQLMAPDARVVVEVANIKHENCVTTLAWDIGEEISKVLHFDGEIVICWDQYGSGYDHSYCLIFSKPK